jgi:hypothetical protein
MITPYLAQQPIDDFGSRFADLKYSATPAVTTDTTLTIPGNAQRYKALIKVEGNGHVWVAINATAAVPGGAAFAATTSELVPQNGGICREVRAGDVLHFYTATANIDVSVVLYAVGTPN